MSFVGYLLLGSLVYVAGFMLHLKVLKPKKQAGMPVKKLTILAMSVCFLTLLFVSFLIGQWVLGHKRIDVVYILINSVIATGIFYVGLNPDEHAMTPPD